MALSVEEYECLRPKLNEFELGRLPPRFKGPNGSAAVERINSKKQGTVAGALFDAKPHSLHLQSALKLSWKAVTVPLALMVMCKVSCTRKLLSGPWPIIRKLLTKVRLD